MIAAANLRIQGRYAHQEGMERVVDRVAAIQVGDSHPIGVHQRFLAGVTHAAPEQGPGLFAGRAHQLVGEIDGVADLQTVVGRQTDEAAFLVAGLALEIAQAPVERMVHGVAVGLHPGQSQDAAGRFQFPLVGGCRLKLQVVGDKADRGGELVDRKDLAIEHLRVEAAAIDQRHSLHGVAVDMSEKDAAPIERGHVAAGEVVGAESLGKKAKGVDPQLRQLHGVGDGRPVAIGVGGLQSQRHGRGNIEQKFASYDAPVGSDGDGVTKLTFRVFDFQVNLIGRIGREVDRPAFFQVWFVQVNWVLAFAHGRVHILDGGWAHGYQIGAVEANAADGRGGPPVNSQRFKSGSRIDLGGEIFVLVGAVIAQDHHFATSLNLILEPDAVGLSVGHGSSQEPGHHPSVLCHFGG